MIENVCTRKIVLTGRIPSKKNSKIIIPNWKVIRHFIKTGMKLGQMFTLIPSSKHKVWHKDASTQLLQFNRSTGENINSIHLTITFGDRRKADLTNKAESLFDLLVDNKIIKDDSWQHTGPILLTPKYEKNVFKAEILIFTKKEV